MVSPADKRTAGSSTMKSVAENVKDTLESIVVAFILAFVFRAFIVEAFVIPTGSMADTLYGEQLLNTCSICGFEYALGVTPTAPKQGKVLCCPNCNAGEDVASRRELGRPNSGDRILVHKWPLDMPGDYFRPKRWEVTVFKDPRDGTTNFIKRLVGLPGEVLEIIDGDIYAAPLEKLRAERPDLVEDFDALRIKVRGFAASSGSEEGIQGAYARLNRELLAYLQIKRKNDTAAGRRAQASLWFNVYDHDYLPQVEERSPQHVPGWWPVEDPAAERAWIGTSDDDPPRREIRFESDAPNPLAIRFAGKRIDDFYAYDNDGVGQRLAPENRHLVGDLRLSFVWQPERGGGGLVLTMNRDRDEFVTSIGTDGQVRVDRRELEPGAPRQAPRPLHEIGQRRLGGFVPGRAVAIEFVNVDYRVSLLIDGEEVIASTDEQYGPSPRLARLLGRLDSSGRWFDVLPSRVSIAAHDLVCSFRHLTLERDVYYRSQSQTERVAKRAPERPNDIGENNAYQGWPGWGTAGRPIMLRDTRTVGGQTHGAEYFMLGDNSPHSKDSRLWWQIGPHLRHLEDYQIATVPRDQLIGKAFFVYWPSGFRRSWAGGIGLIPNFGEMRWIR